MIGKKRGEQVDVKYNITVNLDRKQNVTLVVKKKDHRSRKIYFNLMSGGKAFDVNSIYAGSVKAIKADGKIVFDGLEIKDGKIYYEIPEQMTNVVGEVEFETEFFGSEDEVITSFQMLIVVENNTFDEETLISEDYIEGFRGYMNTVQNIYMKILADLNNIEMMYGSFEEIQGDLEAAKQEYVTYMTDLQEKVKNGYFNGARGPRGEDGNSAIIAEETGIIAFQIEDGNLVCYYYDTTPPPIEIDDTGHLAYIFGG